MKSRKVEIESYNLEMMEQEQKAFEQRIKHEKVLSHRIANTNLFQI